MCTLVYLDVESPRGGFLFPKESLAVCQSHLDDDEKALILFTGSRRTNPLLPLRAISHAMNYYRYCYRITTISSNTLT